MKRDIRQIEKHKLDSLINDNIRLRSAVNRIWLKWYFVPVIFIGTFLSAFAGAMLGN